MKQEVIQQATGLTVAGGAILGGVGTILQWLPPVLGCVATLTGIVLSVVLIFKGLSERKYREILIKDFEVRKKEGLALRRHSDGEILKKIKK